MYKVKEYRVVPSLPEKLSYLKELAYNLYWTWDHNSQALFRRLDSELWQKYERNPVILLGMVSQERLEAVANDDGYLSQLARVRENLDDYMSRTTWFQKIFKDKTSFRIAYFSMEYGLATGVPIYSGGLGILAGDHLKSSSDLGLPLVGVGLLYQQGFFHQYLSKDGWQQETYHRNDFYNLPLFPEKDESGNPILISLDFPKRKVYAQIWRAQVGRIPLYLLDANVPQNSPEDQDITAQLYGGDDEMRIKQEILLGVGGIRALKALNIEPQVCHMNEGHSAFLALERVRQLMLNNGSTKLSFEEAVEATRGGNLFTTHTPVTAGIDQFDTGLVDKYLTGYCESMQVSKERFYNLGGVHFPQTEGKFNMAIFAINMAGNCNGVSKLHGHVAREMWQYLWPETPVDEVPIGHVTNGVHVRTWISRDMAELFYRYLRSIWYRNPADESLWAEIQNIPDEELWRTHERRRERLVAIARAKLQEQLKKSGASKKDIDLAAEVLNPEALTIGFARRFTEYKRAYLLFSDLDRLSKILNDKDKPVQIIIAGKAHPHDKVGKGIIRDIFRIIRTEQFRHKIVFLENYNMKIASYLVQGSDIWLNTPRRPHEASGTSGMKAGANGALNFSILDGWWDEAYENSIGWAIGRGEVYDDHDEQDQVESEALYDLLENEIIPAFYKQSLNGLPREWIAMMKASMQKVCPYFNTNRMVRDYLQNYYIPAAERWSRLVQDDMRAAKQLAEWKQRLSANWQDVKILDITAPNESERKVGEQLSISASLETGKLKPEDLCVEVYYGQLDTNGMIEKGNSMRMEIKNQDETGAYVFQANIPCESTGKHGFSIRVLPHHPELPNPHEMGLIKWFKGD